MGLADRGHEVLMWMPEHERMDELARKCESFVHVIRSHYRNTYDYTARSISMCCNWKVSRRLADEWTSLRPDVIHLNKQNLEDGLDLLRATRACKVPSVCTIHLTQTAGYVGARVAWLRDWIARNALSNYRGVFVAVQETRRLALHAFLAGRVPVRTIFNGVPLLDRDGSIEVREAKRTELGLSRGDFLVLGVGRLEKQKRPFVFIRIARELHKHFPRARFLWVGDGKLAAEWKNKIATEGLEGIVSCAGWQSDVLPFLLAGDLLLHVAEFEGLPLALIEAMAAGLPCAATGNIVAEMPFLNNKNTLLADNVRELAFKLENKMVLAEHAAAGHRLFQEKFSLNTTVAAYEQLYREVTDRRERRRAPRKA
jgi:glycosyltransferase involved in cell wall biosynthesis